MVHARVATAAALPAGPGAPVLDQEVGREPCLGFVALSQSCDIVRRPEDYPFVEVAPLVAMDPRKLAEVKAGRRTRYAIVPGVEERCLVADLGQVMSVAKGVLEELPRTVGCRDDVERRRFASAVARKYSRFAFPDDFVELMKPLRTRLDKRAGKTSEEGKAVTALYEVRVRPYPSWEDHEIQVHIWFLRDEQDEPDEVIRWEHWCDEWLRLVGGSAKYTVTGLPAGLEDLTARDYIESDPLDLDHLSADPDEEPPREGQPAPRPA